MSPAHSFNGLLGTLSSLTHHLSPSNSCSMPILSPTSSKGTPPLCSCSPAPQPHLTPPGPGLSHLLAKKAPTVTRAPSATAPVSTVLTEAQFPSRRRRASSRAPSPYRAVNSACGREGKQERKKEKGRSGEGRVEKRGEEELQFSGGRCQNKCVSSGSPETREEGGLARPSPSLAQRGHR